MPNATPTSPIIDLEHDKLSPVSKICEQKTGRRPSPQAIWRYRKKGCRGVRLECVLVQGVWHTTEAAFAAFIRGQTDAAVNGCKSDDQESRTPDRERELQSAGLI